MAQLDKFFGVLLQPGVTELVFVSGQQPVVVTAEGPRPASSARPGPEQLLNLLSEVVEPAQLEILRQTGSAQVDVNRPGLPTIELAVSFSGPKVEAHARVSPRASRVAPAVLALDPPAPPASGASAYAVGAPSVPVPAATPASAYASAAPVPAATPASAYATAAPPPPLAAAPLAGPPAVAAAALAAAAAPLVESSAARGAATPPAQPSAVMRPASGFPIDDLFREMLRRRASDLHLSSGEHPVLRVDGEIERLEDRPKLTPESLSALVMAIAPERNREEFARSNDTDYAYELPGEARFRCNVFRDRKGPGAVFRVIPSKILTAEQLGLSQGILDLCKLTKGLVLVTGPTGSGKSTTLTAMVDHINTIRRDHIITIEDPIEFVHENRNCLVNQREVATHTESFKRALRAALREDPDIVLVGEMRDLETVAIAIETAETGHLVFGTLHTTTAVSTVDRIIDQFPADQQAQVRTMLSDALRGVIAQVLCKKIGGGRVAALEVLIGVPSVANLVREGKTFQIPSIMQTGKKYGMVTLNDALVDLVRKGLITTDEAYLRAVDKGGIASQLKQLS